MRARFETDIDNFEGDADDGASASHSVWISLNVFAIGFGASAVRPSLPSMRLRLRYAATCSFLQQLGSALELFHAHWPASIHRDLISRFHFFV